MASFSSFPAFPDPPLDPSAVDEIADFWSPRSLLRKLPLLTILHIIVCPLRVIIRVYLRGRRGI